MNRFLEGIDSYRIVYEKLRASLGQVSSCLQQPVKEIEVSFQLLKIHLITGN